MNKETTERLEELLLTQIEQASELEAGSEEAKLANDSIVKLCNVLNESSKIQNDYEIQTDKIEHDKEVSVREYELKQAQLEQNNDISVREYEFKQTQLEQNRDISVRECDLKGVQLVQDQEASVRENCLKEKQQKLDERNQKIKHALEAAGITVSVASLALTAWAFVKGLVFEENGTIRTPEGRSALNAILRFRK